MNDPGIITIYYIKKNLVAFPVFFDPGIVINISGYLSGTLQELTFEPGTVSIHQGNEETPAGMLVKTDITFVVSEVRPSVHALLSRLASRPHVFVFKDMEGQYQLCGTNHYKAKFNYKLNHQVPPQSIKNYTAEITWISTHGLIFGTI